MTKNNSQNQRIRKDMTIAAIIETSPEAVDVLLAHGLHCVGCGAMNWETLEQGALNHGFDQKNIDKIVDDLNFVFVQEGKK